MRCSLPMSRAGIARFGSSGAADSTFGDSTFGDSTVGDSTVGDSTVGGSTVGGSTFGDSTFEDSTVGWLRVGLLAVGLFFVAGSFGAGGARADDLIASDAAVERQFDFWIGEWTVNNRFLDSAGEWHDGGTARARIVPILGGKALVERWHGTTRGNKTIGFSLRSWDPARGKWRILLNWPGGGNPSFGIMEGAFRHGRGEFLGSYTNAEGMKVTNRFTFSDARRDSCRWDSATSTDGGQNWRTSWIMEFSRTAPATEMKEDDLFADHAEPDGCPHAQADQFDFLLGDWAGKSAAGTHRFRATKIIEQCMIVSMFETTREDGSRTRRFAVRAFVPRSGRWEMWLLDDQDPAWKRVEGAVGRGRATLETAFTPAGGTAGRRLTWTGLRDPGSFTQLEELSADGGSTWRTDLEVDFRRED